MQDELLFPLPPLLVLYSGEKFREKIHQATRGIMSFVCLLAGIALHINFGTILVGFDSVLSRVCQGLK